MLVSQFKCDLTDHGVEEEHSEQQARQGPAKYFCGRAVAHAEQTRCSIISSVKMRPLAKITIPTRRFGRGAPPSRCRGPLLQPWRIRCRAAFATANPDAHRSG